MSKTINNNSDFLFVYEAINCNPNGDPDQENKPRMDYETSTNLVTDVRLKRYIRDYLLQKNPDSVFVSMNDDVKVSAEKKFELYVKKLTEDENFRQSVFENDKEFKKELEKTLDDESSLLDYIKKKENSSFGRELLKISIRNLFTDIRMFGGAFAVKGITQPITGAIQINWGYSFNKVELIEPNSIVTIMHDDTSTFGKDHRVYYSLLGFYGTINKNAAATTGLTEADRDTFREAIWNAIPSLPTRSKINQFPKLYLELVYDEKPEYHNGMFGDLRNYISADPKEGLDFKKVRKFSDLVIDSSDLKKIVTENKGADKPIKDVIIKTSEDFNFEL